MSIYSGFGTRQQETNYNKAVYNLLYLMQLKISRNSKSCKKWDQSLYFYIVPFDDHRFQQIFMKLYNRLFTQEEFKYLPPKFSYALKDLATDLGVFERADVSSIVSGVSTNLSMTTTSGFNLNFRDDPSNPQNLLLRNERDAFPLSTIKEQASQMSRPSAQQAHPAYP